MSPLDLYVSLATASEMITWNNHPTLSLKTLNDRQSDGM